MSTQANQFEVPRSAGAPAAKILVFDFVAATLMRGRKLRMLATSEEMAPAIREGQRVTIEPVAPADVKPGDVVLLRRGTEYYLRRVVEVEGGTDGCPAGLMVRGDAPGEMVEPAELWRLLGRATTVDRSGNDMPLSSDPTRFANRVRSSARRLSYWLLGA